jgi:hypothetical protein
MTDRAWRWLTYSLWAACVGMILWNAFGAGSPGFAPVLSSAMLGAALGSGIARHIWAKRLHCVASRGVRLVQITAPMHTTLVGLEEAMGPLCECDELPNDGDLCAPCQVALACHSAMPDTEQLAAAGITIRHKKVKVG